MNFPCLFCQHEMTGHKHEDTVGLNFLAWVWHCKKCCVHYGIERHSATITYCSTLHSKNEYNLVTNLVTYDTYVYYTNTESMEGYTILHIPYLIHNVTPTNLKDKIKTLLTFS